MNQHTEFIKNVKRWNEINEERLKTLLINKLTINSASFSKFTEHQK